MLQCAHCARDSLYLTMRLQVCEYCLLRDLKAINRIHLVIRILHGGFFVAMATHAATDATAVSGPRNPPACNNSSDFSQSDFHLRYRSANMGAARQQCSSFQLGLLSLPLPIVDHVPLHGICLFVFDFLIAANAFHPSWGPQFYESVAISEKVAFWEARSLALRNTCHYL